jgi:hypothetical protein
MSIVQLFEVNVNPVQFNVVEQLEAHFFAVVLDESVTNNTFDLGFGTDPVILLYFTGLNATIILSNHLGRVESSIVQSLIFNPSHIKRPNITADATRLPS